MNEIITGAITSIISLIIGGLSGYAYAYFSGLKAVRKGMQLLLRITLDSLHNQFTVKPPTADEKRTFEEIYSIYEKLADNGVMDAKHEEVIHMRERK
jgi:hypothetical protein